MQGTLCYTKDWGGSPAWKHYRKGLQLVSALWEEPTTRLRPGQQHLWHLDTEEPWKRPGLAEELSRIQTSPYTTVAAQQGGWVPELRAGEGRAKEKGDRKNQASLTPFDPRGPQLPLQEELCWQRPS